MKKMQRAFIAVGSVLVISMFSGCWFLIPVTLDNATTIGSGTKTIKARAYYDKGIEIPIIPDGVQSIGKEAFAKNEFSWAIIPESCTEIASDAFDKNVKLIYMRDRPGEFIGDYKIVVNDNEVTITNYVGANMKVVIPNEINGMPVVEIGASAFSSKGIKSVQIPDTVRIIRADAFRRNKLEKIIIPDTVTTIGGSAFNTNLLTEVTLPKKLTTIEGNVFDTNLITNIVIPDSVTTIGKGAFRYNTLRTLIIPDSVTTIGDYAFYHAYNEHYLKEIILSKNLVSIGKEAFYPRYEDRKMTVTIPDSVESIGELAFWYDVKLVGNTKFETATLDFKPPGGYFGSEQGSEVGKLYLHKVDGNGVYVMGYWGMGDDRIFLTRGSHTFNISLSGRGDGWKIDDITFDYEFESGKEYKLSCEVSVVLDIKINGGLVKRILLGEK
jgi:hypothetical protein